MSGGGTGAPNICANVGSDVITFAAVRNMSVAAIGFSCPDPAMPVEILPLAFPLLLPSVLLPVTGSDDTPLLAIGFSELVLTDSELTGSELAIVLLL